MKIRGRIQFDKHITLEQLDSLVEDVRGLAYPSEPDLANYCLYFELDTDDFAEDAVGLGAAAARALHAEANQLGVKYEQAAQLVRKAVAACQTWDELVNIVETHGYSDVQVLD